MSGLDEPHDLADRNVIGKGVGATGGAVAALVAGFQLLPAAGLDFRQKAGITLGKINYIHEKPSKRRNRAGQEQYERYCQNKRSIQLLNRLRAKLPPEIIQEAAARMFCGLPETEPLQLG